MKRTITHWILSNIIILACVSTSAQVLELDLSMARKLALENNPQYKLAQEAAQKSQAQVIEARGGLLPTLSAFSNYQRAWELPTIFFDNPDPTGPEKISFKVGSEHTFMTGISFQQPLFLGGAAWSGYQLSLHGQAISESQTQSVQQEILLSVTSAYYGVLFARSVVGVMEEALNTAERNLDQVKKIRMVGKASNFDVLRAEVQVANYQPQVVSAKNNARLAESRIKMILGIRNNPRIIINDQLLYIENELSDYPLEKLMEITLANRPEMSILEEQKQIAQRQLALARAAQLPSLIFATSYQYQGERDDFEFTNDDFYTAFNSSLSLNIPLFSGLRTSAKIQQAKIGINEVNYQQEALVTGLRLEVESAYFTIQEAEENVSTQVKTIAQAEEALRLANLTYAEGASTQLDVMNAEFAVNQAKLNYQKSLFEYNTALARLKKALNQL